MDVKWGAKMTDAHANNMVWSVVQPVVWAKGSVVRMPRSRCKMGCKNDQCTCKKHGLECSPACGVCKGVSCENAQEPDIEHPDVDQDN